MNALPGVGGSLFPGRYLEHGLPEDAVRSIDGARLDRVGRQLEAWWSRVAALYGPATGVRTLVDMVAAPLFGRLGFRLRDAAVERPFARARLETPAGRSIALVLLPWASGRTALWRDAAGAARAIGARWCFVFAPPSLSLVDCRGHAFRRSVDFTLPHALSRPSITSFWLLARAGAFDPAPTQAGESTAAAAIDGLLAAGARFQDAVRSDLQHGVATALHALGGVLGRAQRSERAQPAEGASSFDEALTLIYRILFLLFAESRDLVPRFHPIYAGAYTVSRLCHDALASESPAGLWEGLAAVTRLARLGCRTADLIVEPFNGQLFARRRAPALESAPNVRPSRRTTANDRAMRDALVALGTRKGPAGRESISYADLGVEQLGAVYERVLDWETEKRSRASLYTNRKKQPGFFSQRLLSPSPRVHSPLRKATGTFYTPQPLAEFVVRRTLAPLVAGASADAILALRVVDPAMGSGAFLVAACRYLAGAYERALVEEGRASATDFDVDERANIRRLITERCLAGVDTNPVAVQLARLSLWLTSLARGKPLTFLDHRLRAGNSLIGASPDDVLRVPDRRSTSGSSLPLFADLDLERRIGQVTRPLIEMTERRDDSVRDVRAKEVAWTRLAGDQSPIGPWRVAANLWCAQWFGQSRPSRSELRAAMDAVLRRDSTLPLAPLSAWLDHARAIARELGFFHWPLEFPDVFYDTTGRPRARPGFDAVIGNPPWEMLRRDNDARRDGTREPEPRNLVSFLRESSLYPSCDRGQVNLYQPFLDRALTLARTGGRVGLILPWGAATDDGAARLRARLLDESALDTIVGLDNSAGMFPIHRGLRFLVVVASPGGRTASVRARFGVRTADELDGLPGRDDPARPAYPIRLRSEAIAVVGGSTRRIPDVRRLEDLALLERLAAAHRRLGDATGWSARFGRELNATEDRVHFGTTGLPVIEGKDVAPFVAHARAARDRIARRLAERALPGRDFDRPRLAYRDVSGVGNRLSLIAAIVPAGVVTTHTLFCLRGAFTEHQQHFLCGLFNSYVLNTVVRMLMGGHVTTSLVESLPVPAWTDNDRQRRIARLARRLAMHPRAVRTAAVLQAGVARLYGLDLDTFARLLDGFPLVPASDRRLALASFAAPGP